MSKEVTVKSLKSRLMIVSAFTATLAGAGVVSAQQDEVSLGKYMRCLSAFCADGVRANTGECFVDVEKKIVVDRGDADFVRMATPTGGYPLRLPREVKDLQGKMTGEYELVLIESSGTKVRTRPSGAYVGGGVGQVHWIEHIQSNESSRGAVHTVNLDPIRNSMGIVEGSSIYGFAPRLANTKVQANFHGFLEMLAFHNSTLNEAKFTELKSAAAKRLGACEEAAVGDQFLSFSLTRAKAVLDSLNFRD